MQVSKCQCDLCCVKLSFFLREALHLRKVFEEFSALNKVHNEVDAIGLLKDVVHPDDERMVHLQQDQLLDLE